MSSETPAVAKIRFRLPRHTDAAQNRHHANHEVAVLRPMIVAQSVIHVRAPLTALVEPTQPASRRATGHSAFGFVTLE